METRRAQTGAALALLEAVASESPDLLRFVVESLAASPARPALLETVKLFGVEHEGHLIRHAEVAAKQLDRLEAQTKWKEPTDVLGDVSLSTRVLERFAAARAHRWSLREAVPPALLRVHRLLTIAVRKENAAAMVLDCLSPAQRPADRGRAETLVHDFLSDRPRR